MFDPRTDKDVFPDFTHIRQDGLDLFVNGAGNGFAVDADKNIIGVTKARDPNADSYRDEDEAVNLGNVRQLKIDSASVLNRLSVPTEQLPNPDERKAVDELFIIPVEPTINAKEFATKNAQYEAENDAWMGANQQWRTEVGDKEYARVHGEVLDRLDQEKFGGSKILSDYAPRFDDTLIRKMLLTLKLDRASQYRKDAAAQKSFAIG